MERKCKRCGTGYDYDPVAQIKFCPECMDACPREKEKARGEAEALGLELSPHGQPRIPDGYIPIGYVAASGDLGCFKVFAAAGRYYYKVKTWDCPEGTQQAPLIGVVRRPEAAKTESAESVPVVTEDDYGNPIYGDGEELL